MKQICGRALQHRLKAAFPKSQIVNSIIGVLERKLQLQESRKTRHGTQPNLPLKRGLVMKGSDPKLGHGHGMDLISVKRLRLRKGTNFEMVPKSCF